MILKELKDWINALPEEFMEFTVVNGEEGKLDDQYWYRVDKPVVTLIVDEKGNEIVILNELDRPFSPEDINDIKDENEHTD